MLSMRKLFHHGLLNGWLFFEKGRTHHDWPQDSWDDIQQFSWFETSFSPTSSWAWKKEVYHASRHTHIPAYPILLVNISQYTPILVRWLPIYNMLWYIYIHITACFFTARLPKRHGQKHAMHGLHFGKSKIHKVKYPNKDRKVIVRTIS